MNNDKEMNELFDKKAEERFDIKKKRISMLKIMERIFKKIII